MFNRGHELIKLCNEKNKHISDIVIEKALLKEEVSYDEFMADMKLVYETMNLSANEGLEKEVISISGLTGGNAKKVEDYRNNNKTIAGDIINKAMARALSTSEVNAAMGRIVAAPTAGASGILPGVITSVNERFDLDEETIINGLLNSSAIGEIIAKNATISGAEGGCQAECGTASSMAASALVEMLGGSPEQCLHAASFALLNIMGLVCDPVAGLVEFPCALRNASGVTNALISADLALAGVETIIPFDEIVDTMYDVGRSMPAALRETALGGIAATKTGEEIKRRIL